MHTNNEFILPFSALIGLSDAKLALILTIIDPKIGGVLISGPKGTGKSTLVRALNSVLPQILVRTCSFQCSPEDPKMMCEACKLEFKTKNSRLDHIKRQMKIVTLPLGATEDRVIGSLDIEKIIESGIEALSPGLLAHVNQDVLYIDEINLLPDHLVDTILDCAASGWNIIERENISIQHPSNFILVGTMNPEEGDLRPQLLDRLSLYAEAENVQDIQERIRVIELNLALEKSGDQLHEYRERDKEIQVRIENARRLLSLVELNEKHKKYISTLCMNLKVDGFRSDIVLARSSRAKAAFEGKKKVSNEDILSCAYLTLLHRTREGGMREPPSRLEINKICSKIRDI